MLKRTDVLKNHCVANVDAGSFSDWLRRMRASLADEKAMNVPCQGCIACCQASSFILIRPEETRTLARIPKKYLAAAPGMPRGNRMLGYLENGACPMLVQGRCSIYSDRPRACRHYDCRIFAAAGITTRGRQRTPVDRRVRRWQFRYPASRDRDLQAAVKAAARFIRKHAECFPARVVKGNPGVALLAIQGCEVFLKNRPGRRPASALETAHAILEAGRCSRQRSFTVRKSLAEKGGIEK